MHHPGRIVLHQMMTGLCMPITTNLRWLTFFIDMLRWVQNKLTCSWIYGQQLYLSQILIIPNAWCHHLQVRNIYIDTPLAGTKWSKLSVKYSGTQPPLDQLPWMDQMFNVWFRDLLACIHNILENLDFKQSFNYVPYWEFQADNNEQRYQDFMSGDWAWLHVVS